MGYGKTRAHNDLGLLRDAGWQTSAGWESRLAGVRRTETNRGRVTGKGGERDWANVTSRPIPLPHRPCRPLSSGRLLSPCVPLLCFTSEMRCVLRRLSECIGSCGLALVRILDLFGRAERCVRLRGGSFVAGLTKCLLDLSSRRFTLSTFGTLADLVQDLYISQLKAYKPPAPVRLHPILPEQSSPYPNPPVVMLQSSLFFSRESPRE